MFNAEIQAVGIFNEGQNILSHSRGFAETENFAKFNFSWNLILNTVKIQKIIIYCSTREWKSHQGYSKTLSWNLKTVEKNSILLHMKYEYKSFQQNKVGDKNYKQSTFTWCEHWDLRQNQDKNLANRSRIPKSYVQGFLTRTTFINGEKYTSFEASKCTKMVKILTQPINCKT